MQKIEVGQTVFHNKTNTLGEVIETTTGMATVRIADYKDNELLSYADTQLPIHELKIVEVKQQGENDTVNLTEKVRYLVQTIVKDMVTLLYFTAADKQEYDESIKSFMSKVEDARAKEEKVPFPSTELDKTVAIADALTDTNYFVNGTFVELGEKPISYALPYDKVDEKRYPTTHRLYTQVAEFHEVGGHPVAQEPTVLTLQRVLDRSGYTVEELVEFLHAYFGEDFQKEVDNLLEVVKSESITIQGMGKTESEKEKLDTQFIVMNTINNHVLNLFKAFRLPSVELADIVHNANMTKFYINEKGEYYAKRRESDNKILKSPNFEAPEPHIRKLIEDWLAN